MKKKRVEEGMVTLEELLDQEGDYLQAQWVYN
jgi:hypothetical protein